MQRQMVEGGAMKTPSGTLRGILPKNTAMASRHTRSPLLSNDSIVRGPSQSQANSQASKPCMQQVLTCIQTQHTANLSEIQ